MSESLAAVSILCTRRVTLRLGVERQRYFVRGRRPLLVRSSDSEDGAVGDSSKKRRWRWPCLGDLGSLSLCLPGALVENTRR